MNRIRIPVVKSSDIEGGIKTIVGVITADTLIKRYFVPERNHFQKTGYQRAASQSRVNSLATDLMKGKVDLPTAVLLSIRKPDHEDVLHIENEKYFLDLIEDDPNEDQKTRLYVVDGQHRIKALARAIEKGAQIRNYKIPFVCMLGATEDQEMKQFHIINSNAKSVPTALALELIKERARHSQEFMDDLIRKGKKWMVDAEIATEMLAESSLVWKGKIRFHNMPKGKTTLPSSSMVKSLEPLFRHTPAFMAIKDPEINMQIIDAYWMGIRESMPAAFDDISLYSIQKGGGVRVLHGIFPFVMEIVRAQGRSIFSKEAYREIVYDPLHKVEGYNGHNDHVDGIDFWRTGKDGVIGKCSNEPALTALIEMLKSHLPEFDA